MSTIWTRDTQTPTRATEPGSPPVWLRVDRDLVEQVLRIKREQEADHVARPAS